MELLRMKGSRFSCSLVLVKFFLSLTLILSFTLSYSYAEITVTDFRGKTLKLKKPAERVVCLIESALSGIYMLNQGHKVVGIPTNVYDEGFYYSETFKYYSALDKRISERKIPALGNWESVNIEKVLSLKPDLVIIWSSQRDAIETLERVGIPVYGVFITKIEDLFKEIRDFGVLFNAEKRAEELINFVNSEINQIKKISKKIKMPRKVYFSWSQHSFLQTACRGSIVDEIISLVGGVNICGDIKAESLTLTLERLIKLNPDLIVMWHSKNLSPENLIKNNQLKLVNAVKNSRVYQFEDTFFFDLWTLKFIYATKFIAKSVYPEFFAYDLKKEKDRIVRFLYGKSLK